MSEPLTEDYLLTLAADQQSEAQKHHDRGGTRCPKCSHQEHGFMCSLYGNFKSCECPSSYWEGRA